ncbi:MAG TPA: hypothetical protein VGF39_03065, partial [Stellaceae bacterium]
MTLLFWHIKRAKSGAPADPVISIDGVEYVVGEPIDLLPIMEDMAKRRRRIVTNIGVKLNDGKFVGGNAFNQLALVEPARHHVLSRVERIQNERLARDVAKEQTFAKCRSVPV